MAGRQTASDRARRGTSGGGAVRAGRGDERRLAEVQQAPSRPGGSTSRSSGVSRSKPSRGSVTTWSVASGGAAARTCASKLRDAERGLDDIGREQQQAVRAVPRVGRGDDHQRPSRCPPRAPRRRHPAAGRATPRSRSGRSAGRMSTDRAPSRRAAAMPSVEPFVEALAVLARWHRRWAWRPAAGRSGRASRRGPARRASSRPARRASGSACPAPAPRAPPRRARRPGAPCRRRACAAARPRAAVRASCAGAGSGPSGVHPSHGSRPGNVGRPGQASPARQDGRRQPLAVGVVAHHGIGHEHLEAGRTDGVRSVRVAGVDDQGVQQAGVPLLVVPRDPERGRLATERLEQPVGRPAQCERRPRWG